MVCTFGQMLMCAMPLLIARGGHSVSLSGLTVASFSFASVFCRPFTGFVVPKLPGRRAVVGSLIILSLSSMALAASPPLWIVILLRMLQGATMCFYGTIFGAMVSRMIPADRFQEGMGYYSMGVPAMSFLGPALGLTVLRFVGAQGMFLLLVIWMLASAFLCSKCEGGEEPVAPPPPPGVHNPFRVSFEARAVFPAILLMLVSISHNSLVSFLSLYAETRGGGNITRFYLVAGLGIIAIRLLLTAAPQFFNEQRLMIPALFILGGSLFIVPILNIGLPFYLMGLLYGCAQGIVQPGLIASALTRCSPERRAAATATYYLGIDLGSGVGGLLWAKIVEVGGYSWVYTGAAIIVFAVALTTCFYAKRLFTAEPSYISSRS